ncbi:hypothetical protein [Arthrobacter sp. YN]|uniref:hypothetical protein n=1 Tax=Arthrobacter sp. YN TaxID=2020486 RepID=UPI0012FDD43B|nr:hypothetical protein [Arthrobacter sp. YN]
MEYVPEGSQEGGLEAGTVGRLIAELDVVFECADAEGKRGKLDFTTRKGDVLAGLVADYTAKLATVHGLGRKLLPAFEKTNGRTTGNESVDALRRLLLVQQRILRDTE